MVAHVALIVSRCSLVFIRSRNVTFFCCYTRADCLGRPPPPKSCEVYVGRIPRDVSELELWLLFSTIGDIYLQRFKVDFRGANRGFAFVRFIELQDADRAVAELNNFEMRLKHKIVVAKSFKAKDDVDIDDIMSKVDWLLGYNSILDSLTFFVLDSIYICTQVVANY